MLCHYVCYLCFFAVPFELEFINLFAAHLGILNSLINKKLPWILSFSLPLPLWKAVSIMFTGEQVCNCLPLCDKVRSTAVTVMCALLLLLLLLRLE